MAASPPLSKPSVYVAMGVSGCGKTSVGQAVATHLRLDFVEGDSLHPPANIAKMSSGIPLDDSDRMPWLDLIGERISASVEAGQGLVVSCSALKKIYRDRLRAFANGGMTFLYLKGSHALLAGRMAARKGHFMPASLLDSQFATLEDPTGEPGVIAVDISGPVSDVIARTIEKIAP